MDARLRPFRRLLAALALAAPAFYGAAPAAHAQTPDSTANAEEAVLEIGAGKAPEQPGETFRVFLDPAGHPFCIFFG